MADHNVLDFFHAKKQKAGGDIDWTAKRNDWLEAIKRFYGVVTEQYLASAITTGDLKVSYEPKTLVEEYLGQYETPELVLHVGDERVVFSPKGRNIVGAAGRIDLIGERGERTLVVQPGERWGIVASRSPVLKIVPLDQDALLDALREIMRP